MAQAQQSQAQPQEGFVSFAEEDVAADAAHWLELLAAIRYRKGLVRASIRAFAGPKGYREIGEAKFFTSTGAPVENTGDQAAFNAAKICQNAYQCALRHSKRHGINLYRLQLHIIKKKGGEEHLGEFSTLNLAGGGGSHGYTEDPASAVWKALIEHNTDLRGFLEKVLGAQVEMAQANGQTMVHANEQNRMAADMRIEASKLLGDAQLQRRQATPEQINQRLETIGGSLLKGLEMAMKLKGFHNPGHKGSRRPGPKNTGANGSPRPSSSTAQDAATDTSQQRAQAFFESLSADQKDKLRDMLDSSAGAGCFASVVQAIMGDASAWQVSKTDLFQILEDHQPQLLQILTPEQIAELIALQES